MEPWNLSVRWEDTSSHGEESFTAIVRLPAILKAYAVVSIGRGSESGGHSIEVFDNEVFTLEPLDEVHTKFDLPLEDQAISAIAVLVQWVKDALYKLELDKLDPIAG